MPSALLQGFDEYMNLVLDEGEEVHLKTKTRKTLGKYILSKRRASRLAQLSPGQNLPLRNLACLEWFLHFTISV